MNIINKEKFDVVIQKLLTDKLTCGEIINHLNENRFKYLNSENSNQENNRKNLYDEIVLSDLNLNKNSNQLEQNSILDNRISSNFVSYFLNLLHEEGNKYLPIRNSAALAGNSNQNKNTNFDNSSNELSKFNNRFNAENIFNSPSSSTTTPKCNSASRKISLKPLNTSRSGGGNNLSPIESFQNSNRAYNNNNSNSNFRKHSSSISAHNSPSTCVHSPRGGHYSNSSKPQPKTTTLFDYLVTPIKSPNHNSSDSPVVISDFKARFQQHQQQLIQQNHDKQQLLQQQRQLSQTSLNNQTIDHEMSMADNDNEQNNKINETELRIDNSSLSLNLKEKLNETEIEKLSLLAKFYSQLILNNFILTINTELFFLFQLLTLNTVEDKTHNQLTQNTTFKLFPKIESCIYFSINVISNLESILKYLKSSTIIELKENIYIKSFSHLFSSDSYIFNHEISKEEIKQKSKLVFYDVKLVPFNAETNTRDNFQDKNIFITSKNQRDLFFDILMEWLKNHKQENWNFSENLGDKIRSLVTIKENSANFIQFTKLFQEQLVIMCKDDRMLIDKNEEIDGPDNIKATFDPMKLRRLNARMSTPYTHYGPNPAPKFMGYQQFFKDFIDLSCSPPFHQCLKDSMAFEIENIQRELPRFENRLDNSLDKDAIEDTILRLRILGKFFGYLVFYPYQYSVSNFLIKDMSLIRNNSSLIINLQLNIERAIRNKHLILTIPFIVEFLSMMDENAILIDSIQYTVSILIMIFKYNY